MKLEMNLEHTTDGLSKAFKKKEAVYVRLATTNMVQYTTVRCMIWTELYDSRLVIKLILEDHRFNI